MKLNSLELLHEGAMVGNVLPETLEDSADMVPYSEFIIELAGGASMLNIWRERNVFLSENEREQAWHFWNRTYYYNSLK